jgi:hypothetical protein
VRVDGDTRLIVYFFEDIHKLVRFFVENIDELLENTEMKSWGQDSSPGHPFSS